MVALAGGVLAKVDPISCLTRALLVFFLGWIAGQLWQVIRMVVGQRQTTDCPEQKQSDEEIMPAA